MQRYDDPRSSSSLFVGLLSLLGLLIIVVLAEGFYHRLERGERERKQLPGLGEEAAMLREGQLAQLRGYRPVPGAEDRATLPIERAMELIVEENGRKAR